MNWIKITWIVIGVALIGLIGYDVVAIANGGREASISWQIIQHSYEYPMTVFLTGFVCGHLFWRMKDPTKDEK